MECYFRISHSQNGKYVRSFCISIIDHYIHMFVINLMVHTHINSIWWRQRIPIWWRWFYWVSPTSWSLYGLFSSQFGGLKDTLDSGETVDHYIRTYFGYRKDFLDVVVAVLVGFSLLFVFIFAFAIKKLNFQKR